jgi:hypothetical protein
MLYVKYRLANSTSNDIWQILGYFRIFQNFNLNQTFSIGIDAYNKSRFIKKYYQIYLIQILTF